MRMMIRLRREERGVVSVLFVVLFVVLLGMLALSTDGGLMYVKLRQVRNANDAAALAAAYSCATGEIQAGLSSLDTANLRAQDVARLNAVGATVYGPGNVYPSGCAQAGGTVTVHYQATQQMYVAPLVGGPSSGTASADATATWGAASGSANVIPLVLMKDRLSSCNLVPGPGVVMPAVGTPCVFWWDNNALGNASWGFMALDTWGTTSIPSGCSGGGGTNDITDAIWPGLTTALMLNVPPPTYVCAKNGASVQPVENAITTAISPPNNRTEFAMPVSDPTLQVNVSGAPYKYAIVGFAHLKPTGLYKRNEAGYDACRNANPPVIPAGGDTANSFCLVTTWLGFSTSGILGGGGGQNFGIMAIGLTG